MMRHKAMSGALMLALAAMLIASPCGVWAADDATPSWPEFHGIDRSNISPEKGLLKEWPEGGPKLAWRFTGLGTGFAMVTIADGMIFTSGDEGRNEFLVALDLDGKLLWKTQNGNSWRRQHPGARTAPTFRDGVLYHMSPTGRLGSFDAKTGVELWAVDLMKEFGAKPGTWALAENIFIDGDTLLCAPGGDKGRIVALDKATGKLIWANTEIDENAAYCSPAVITHMGTRQFITILQTSIVSVDVKTGKLLWRHGHETKHGQNVTMPLYKDGYLFATSGHGTGGRMLKIAPDNKSVKELWLNKDMDNCHGGVVLFDGRLHASGCRLFGKGFVCVDMKTGKTLWNEKRLGKVSITYADGMLYCLNDKGRMSLVKPGPNGCKIVSTFDVPRFKKLTLTHPVVCGGRLYVRSWNDLFVYDIK